MRYLHFLPAMPVTLTASTAIADQQGGYYGHHMWGGGWSGWFMGPLMMILFLAVAVVLVVLFVRWSSGDGRSVPTPSTGPAQKTPLDILKERFARGEIDKAEFEERRQTLNE